MLWGDFNWANVEMLCYWQVLCFTVWLMPCKWVFVVVAFVSVAPVRVGDGTPVSATGAGCACLLSESLLGDLLHDWLLGSLLISLFCFYLLRGLLWCMISFLVCNTWLMLGTCWLCCTYVLEDLPCHVKKGGPEIMVLSGQIFTQIEITILQWLLFHTNSPKHGVILQWVLEWLVFYTNSPEHGWCLQLVLEWGYLLLKNGFEIYSGLGSVSLLHEWLQ